ncbi:NADPH-dependent FMN reductase family protein [Nonomuraea cypriaca]|uniref:hypothetical protein n=1 Tax=Nonomuraea cypriaca TaxID=1187855 RepID=UPI001A9CADB0|nr:hypothetical protein [Nonomuraea cypriaca]
MTTGTGNNEPAALARRSLLRGALAAGATMMVTLQAGACSASWRRPPAPEPPTDERAKRPHTPPPASKPGLLAYFSRAGENYYYYGGRRDLKVGNTEVLAQMISSRIDCDVHRIEPAEPYPED